MNKLRRLYNQNRELVIITVVVIAFVIIIIQVLNSIVKKQNENKRNLIANEESRSVIENNTTISPSNVSKITGDTVKSNVSDKEIIEKFVTCCNEKDIESAYSMLSDECRERIYTSKERFNSLYIDRIFSIYRMYTLENWFDTNDYTTYYIKYTEDVMASGDLNSTNNMSDYITVTKERKAKYQ